MFSQEQVNVLWHLVEKGVIVEQDVKNFLLAKLQEVGFVITPPVEPVAPEQPTEVVPPTPETPAVGPDGQPVA